MVTVQTLLHAECNLYLNPKQIKKKKKPLWCFFNNIFSFPSLPITFLLLFHVFGCGYSLRSPPHPTSAYPHPPFHFTYTSLAWQGTDLMHNHVLADDDQSSLDSLGRRSSLSRLEPSDLSEDSDYDSIWTAHSYRMGSTSRKSCCSYISHQN